MGQQFTIESDEAHALAAELASMRGESLEEVVTTALRGEVERQRRIQARIDRVITIAGRIRSQLPDPSVSTAMTEFYDENGLPK